MRRVRILLIEQKNPKLKIISPLAARKIDSWMQNAYSRQWR